MEDVRKEVAIHVKRHRMLQSMTKAELARKVDVSRASIVNIENGTQAVSLNNFCKIAFALKVRPQHLLRDVLESKKYPELSEQEEPDPKLREQMNLSLMS